MNEERQNLSLQFLLRRELLFVSFLFQLHIVRSFASDQNVFDGFYPIAYLDFVFRIIRPGDAFRRFDALADFVKFFLVLALQLTHACLGSKGLVMFLISEKSFHVTLYQFLLLFLLLFVFFTQLLSLLLKFLLNLQLFLLDLLLNVNNLKIAFGLIAA